MRGFSWSATIEAIAAKLSWKLAPTSDSGQSSSTIKAPTASSRKVSASRPSAIPARMSSAATQERIVGTSAPVSSV